MERSTDGNPAICTNCVGNEDYQKWIRGSGKRGQCEIERSQGSLRYVVPASELAKKVDRWFRENYTEGEEEPDYSSETDKVYYRQRGESYEQIIMDELECDDRVLAAIADHLPDATWHDVSQGDIRFYDSGRYYEKIAAIERRQREEEEQYWYENRFRFQWEEFCEKVQYERRFFRLKEPLDELFGDPKEYEKGTIRPVYMLAKGQKIYRARLLDDTFTETMLQLNPTRALGAPPRERTRDGRMNVEYIPAFYAAFSEETAVAEIRPGIGEKIAIGVFVLQREAKVFDFTSFARAGHEKWKEAYAHTRYDFITQMEGEISKPILPFDKQREYIPTQIVAEYLRDYFECDAVIYRSSMIKDRDQESRNIVLLNKGHDFVGDHTAPLIFSTHTIREVMNVTYELGPDFDL